MLLCVKIHIRRSNEFKSANSTSYFLCDCTYHYGVLCHITEKHQKYAIGPNLLPPCTKLPWEYFNMFRVFICRSLLSSHAFILMYGIRPRGDSSSHFLIRPFSIRKLRLPWLVSCIMKRAANLWDTPYRSSVILNWSTRAWMSIGSYIYIKKHHAITTQNVKHSSYSQWHSTFFSAHLKDYFIRLFCIIRTELYSQKKYSAPTRDYMYRRRSWWKTKTNTMWSFVWRSYDYTFLFKKQCKMLRGVSKLQQQQHWQSYSRVSRRSGPVTVHKATHCPGVLRCCFV